MGLGSIKGVAVPLGLIVLLAACQSGPNPRNPTNVTKTASPSPGYHGCGYHPCAPPRICPPGYILVRIPYGYGGSGRACRPYYPRWGRCCTPPPSPSPCGSPGPQPCGGQGNPRPVY